MLRFAIFFIFWIPSAMAIGRTYTPCDPICFDQASSTKLATITIRLYHGSVDNFTEVLIHNSLDLLGKIDRSKPIVMYAFGWTGDLPLNHLATQAVLRALIGLKSCNVFLLNWDTISLSEYTFAARSVPGVAFTTVKQFFEKLVAAGISTSGMHMIGHSLGAEISGFIGKYLSFLLPRITALDPAKPGFSNPADRLNSSDARFVDVIHTDGGFLGLSEAIGHADFFPNGGVNIQPGCLIGLNICSHYRSCYLFAESVRNERSLIGRKCGSDAEFQANSCGSNSTAVVGYWTRTTERGKFYFQTNNQSPYGRGSAGTTYRARNLLSDLIQSLLWPPKAIFDSLISSEY